MATIQQIDANRRNALKSTGPRTPEGKAAVRMNALRHGLRARTVVLPGEDRNEFHQLCDDLEVEWQPQSRTEQFYLEQMAASQWKLTRMEVGESIVRKRFTYIEEQFPHLDRLWQGQCRMERSYARAQRELERLQNLRRRDTQQSEEPVTPDVPSAADPEVGQPSSPAEPVVAPAAPGASASPRVEPNPRTAGQPHRTAPPEPATLAAHPDCGEGSERDTVVSG